MKSIKKKLICKDLPDVAEDVSGLSDYEIIKAKDKLEAHYGFSFDVVEENIIHRDGAQSVMVPAEMTPFRMLRDNSFTLSFKTGELTDEKLLLLKSLSNTSGVLMYTCAENITDEDVAMMSEVQDNKLESTKKSKSQQLRATLYALWLSLDARRENLNVKERQVQFTQYYNIKMDKIRNHFLSQFPDGIT